MTGFSEVVRWTFVCAVTFVWAARPSDNQGAGLEVGNLRVAESHHYLEYEDGTPFFYLGDTAWELFHRLNREEADRYLKNRAAKGFTVIQAVALAELGGLNVPNAYGQKPLHENDPTRPNDLYFQHVDYIVAQARGLGLFIGMLPTWGSKWKSGDGAEMGIFNPENAKKYGRFLGQRYRDEPIIWILGGDHNPDNERERATIEAMASGLREGDGGRHLLTYHPRGPGLSSDWLLVLDDATASFPPPGQPDRSIGR
jgi:hypothetical protein